MIRLDGKGRLERFISRLLIAILIFIGLVAVLEQGPPLIPIYSGASPYNSGNLGTSNLYQTISDSYPNSFIVGDWSRFLSRLDAPCDEAVIVIISPEYPYSPDEVRDILDFLSSCRVSGLVIADESGNSNSILDQAGLGVNIEDSRILDPLTLLPYPTAVFSSKWFSGEVILDIPAGLSIDYSGYSVIGTVPLGMVVYGEDNSRDLAVDIPIALVGFRNGINFLVISDGSIFLNQAFDTGVWRIIYGFINDTCVSSSCMVIFDSSKFELIDPLSYIDNLDNQNNVDILAVLTPSFIASLIVRLVHPATWLPPAISWVDDTTRSILVDQAIVLIATLISALILGSLIISKLPTSVRDVRLEDVVERDPLALEHLMRSISRREFKATKIEFRRFYEMLDQIVISVVGIGLNDPNLIEVLTSRGVSRDKAESFISRVTKLYRRSMRRIGLPLIVNWSKELVRVSQEAIEILEILGARRI